MLPADIRKLVAPDVAAFLDYTATLAGVCEVPPGSNRGPDIDAWATEFGSPLGSFWCALMVGHTRKKHGLWTPPRKHLTGSCDEWYLAAEQDGLFTRTPVPGAAVLYTNGKRNTSGAYVGRLDAVHIGTVLRVTPIMMSWEGNTTLGKYDRNGSVLALKPTEVARVLGYVLPHRP